MHYPPVDHPFWKKRATEWLLIGCRRPAHLAAGLCLYAWSLGWYRCPVNSHMAWNDRASSLCAIWLDRIAVTDLCVWVAMWKVLVWNGHSCSTGMFWSLAGSTALLSFGQTVSAHPMPPRDTASSLSLYVYTPAFFLTDVMVSRIE